MRLLFVCYAIGFIILLVLGYKLGKWMLKVARAILRGIE